MYCVVRWRYVCNAYLDLMATTVYLNVGAFFYLAIHPLMTSNRILVTLEYGLVLPCHMSSPL
jgi:hypothetical protein